MSKQRGFFDSLSFLGQQIGEKLKGSSGGAPRRSKAAECTPCEMQAYVDSLRPSGGVKKPARKKPRR